MTISAVVFLLVGLAVGLLVGALLARASTTARFAAPLAQATAQRDALAQRVDELSAEPTADPAQALAPLREALVRVERHVGLLERDRVEQFGELGERLTEVSTSTARLREETAGLAGSLNASTIRGSWGETQLRRVLEHAGMLAHCDFEEQMAAITAHDARVRPDVLVRLPGDKVLVIDAKAPLSTFLAAQAAGIDEAERRRHLRGHGAALRGHVDALAKKEYWSAFPTTPQMVVCFVPGDAILAAALDADPALYDHALASKVVLASPATLVALLRTVAFTWQQDALAAGAKELLELGTTLYVRLQTLGDHAARMGGSLRRSVEHYNALVGTLESRVLVTARRMNDLGLSHEAPPTIPVVEATPRPLTAVELLDAIDDGPARRDREAWDTERTEQNAHRRRDPA